MPEPSAAKVLGAPPGLPAKSAKSIAREQGQLCIAGCDDDAPLIQPLSWGE